MANIVIVRVPVSEARRKRLIRNLKRRGLNLHRWAAPLVYRRFGAWAHTYEERGAGVWYIVAAHAWPPVEDLGAFIAISVRYASATSRAARGHQLDLFFDNDQHENGQKQA